mgnify:CR=1 FL=1
MVKRSGGLQFSVGNADRVFEPYRAMENLSRDEMKAMPEQIREKIVAILKEETEM